MIRKYSFLAILFFGVISCRNESKIKGEETKDNIDSTIVSKPMTDLHEVDGKCIETVFKIIESSKEYKEIADGLENNVKQNGGSGIGFTVHVSPNPLTDGALEKGDFYDISLHESYPDRMVNIISFKFDRHHYKLFVADVVNADYLEVSYDTLLLKDFTFACGEK